MAAKELLVNPILKFYMNLGIVHCIPVDRSKPGIQFFKDTINVLKNNKILVVFPEGTRTINGEMQSWKPAFIMLARYANSPIIPTAVNGTFKILPKGERIPRLKKCIIKFGKLQKFNFNRKLKREDMVNLANVIRSEVSNLLNKSRETR